MANSAGNDLHVIDTATNGVIKRVEVGSEPHGLVATANGDRVFITIENTKGDAGELLLVRHRRLKLVPDGKALLHRASEWGTPWL